MHLSVISLNVIKRLDKLGPAVNLESSISVPSRLTHWVLVCASIYGSFSLQYQTWSGKLSYLVINTLRQKQNGQRFAEDIFKGIFLNENLQISINISLKCVPEGQINNIPPLVEVMAWRRPGNKPLSEPTMIVLPSDAIWWYRSGSTLAQVMSCCLIMAPSHYLNQCWLIISKVHWDSSDAVFLKFYIVAQKCCENFPPYVSPWTKWLPCWQTTISNAFS